MIYAGTGKESAQELPPCEVGPFVFSVIRMLTKDVILDGKLWHELTWYLRGSFAAIAELQHGRQCGSDIPCLLISVPFRARRKGGNEFGLLEEPRVVFIAGTQPDSE